MIDVKNTPDLVGLTISGDYLDLDQLYESIHDILPDEGEDIALEYMSIEK